MCAVAQQPFSIRLLTPTKRSPCCKALLPEWTGRASLLWLSDLQEFLAGLGEPRHGRFAQKLQQNADNYSGETKILACGQAAIMHFTYQYTASWQICPGFIARAWLEAVGNVVKAKLCHCSRFTSQGTSTLGARVHGLCGLLLDDHHVELLLQANTGQQRCEVPGVDLQWHA